MRYEKDWARQESSCRRPKDGLLTPFRIAFAGVTLALLESIPPVAKRIIRGIMPYYTSGSHSDDWALLFPDT